MDHKFCKNEIEKIALVIDTASFSDGPVNHRPNLHMYLNCSIFLANFLLKYISVF